MASYPGSSPVRGLVADPLTSFFIFYKKNPNDVQYIESSYAVWELNEQNRKLLKIVIAGFVHIACVLQFLKDL